MSSFWEGVIAGYGIAIPVGAIAILIVDTGLRRGFVPGFMAGAGAATADLIYATLAALAGAALASLFAPYASGLRIIGAVVLLTMGGYGLLRAYRMAGSERDRPTDQEFENAQLAGRGQLRIYGRFLGLTLLNPLTIVYFGALILGRDAGSTVTWAGRAAFVFGAFLASFSWQLLLACVGALAGRYLSNRFQLYATIVGNLVVAFLGLRLLLPVT